MSKNKSDLQKNIEDVRDQIGDLASKAHDAAPATVQRGIEGTAEAVVAAGKTARSRRGLVLLVPVLIAIALIVGRRRSS